MTKKLKLVAISAISVTVASILVVGFFAYQLLKTPMSQDNAEIVFEVSPGKSLTQIAVDLQSKELIRNSSVFLFYARLKRMNSKLKVGEYSLNKAMTPDDILATIASGKSITRNFTIVEGLNIFDIAEIFEKSGYGTKDEFFTLIRDHEFIKSLLAEDSESLEGYLFPETYKITKFETQKSIITQMVKRFLSVWKELEPLAQKNKWSRHQVVTFASIVEKETGASSERPVISSVFHNRLAKKMKLQTDPTVLYGMAIKQGHMPANITKADLLEPTKYNSYTNFGLPPTPISNPGKEALMATLQPANTQFLYFVSQNNGTTVFSETLQKHNLAVQKYQLNPKAREGKSWKDLKRAKK